MNETRELRALLAEERQRGSGTAKRGYSAGLRQRVVSFLSRERGQGVGEAELAKRLGLAKSTVHEWGRAAQGAPFRAVVVRASEEAKAAPLAEGTERSSRLVLEGAAGVRVYGLSVSDVEQLLRRLGC
jgi:DNA-binding IclR family transcriptional regulator